MMSPRPWVFATLSVLLSAAGAGCATAGADKDQDGETVTESEVVLLGCDNWDNWSCQTSTNYCFAQCSYGGADEWMQCYPGTSYDCVGTFSDGDYCEDYVDGDDECDACLSALSVCGV